MSTNEKRIRRRLLRALIKRIRVLREMRQNTFTITKTLRQQYKLRHRANV